MLLDELGWAVSPSLLLPPPSPADAGARPSWSREGGYDRAEARAKYTWNPGALDPPACTHM